MVSCISSIVVSTVPRNCFWRSVSVLRCLDARDLNMSKSSGPKSSAEREVPETSRIIVKNLPKRISEARLREHFQKLGGHITDVKLLVTERGKSRQFAFIGYSTPAEAAAALKHFNRAFLDTNRLVIQFAYPKGDTHIPRAWSKHSEGSSRYAQEQEAKGAANSKKRPSSDIAPAKDDVTSAEMTDAKKRKLEEFLGVNKKGKLWANADASGPGDSMDSKEKSSKKKSAKDAEKDIKKLLKDQDSGSESDDDDYQDFSKLQSSRKPKDSTADDDSSDSEGSDDEMDEDVKSDGGDAKGEGAEKMEVDETQKTEESETQSKSKKKRKDEPEVKKYQTVDSTLVADTGRLFVRNLPFSASEDDITKLFSKFGNVSEVHLSIDKLTKRSKGFGFVLFLFPGHAIEAQKELDGKFFQGRIIHVMAAQQQQQEDANEASSSTDPSAVGSTKPRGPGPQTGGSVGFVSEYQRKKNEKTKDMANQDYNWNSLFIRPDAVASAMASNLSVSKSELLDPESNSSMAVRLALGETNIIKETKLFLEGEGVSLDALKGHYNKSISRSSTVILVKNIPTNTQVEELRNLFGPFGTLLRVVLPPSRTLSVVEFSAPTEARAAFRNLAYKLFKDAPLFLEWAPIGVFGESTTEPSVDSTVLKEVHEKVTKTTVSESTSSKKQTEITKSEQTVSTEKSTETSKKSSKAAPSASEDVSAESPSSAVISKLGSLESVIEEASLTLFIKNLSFDTAEDSLLKLVERLVGPVSNVSIAMHKVKDEMLSQGFGFVECKNREQAVKAWKLLQGSSLDGHQLQVTFSQRKTGSASLADLQKASSKRKSAVSSQPTSTKIMVKNVAFEATRNEIRDLFAPFGELRSVRLPNKAGGKGHRGFAFIEYVTPDEATAAVEALGNTHLYNRRLVIDYAEQDGDVEAIRAKTAAQFEN